MPADRHGCDGHRLRERRVPARARAEAGPVLRLRREQRDGVVVFKKGGAVFQAIGKKVQPLCLSLLRKGSLDMVFMLILNHAVGVSGRLDRVRDLRGAHRAATAAIKS